MQISDAFDGGEQRTSFSDAHGESERFIADIEGDFDADDAETGDEGGDGTNGGARRVDDSDGELGTFGDGAFGDGAFGDGEFGDGSGGDGALADSTDSSSSFADARARPAASVILNRVPRFAVLTVGQPQKVSDGASSYISYLVTSQQYDGDGVERARRRYSDFARLYDQLAAEFRACAVPPLPDRWRIEYIAGDRFSPEFTARRAASLERFLFRVSQHPFLRRSRAFLGFLTAGAASAANASANANANTNTNTNGHANGHANGRAHAAANALAMQTADESAVSTALDHLSEVLMNAFTRAKHQSKEMVGAKERAARYEQNIATLDKAVVWVAKLQSELALDCEQLVKPTRRLAELAPQSAPAFARLGDAAQVLARSTAQLRAGVDCNFACALRDMAHYVQALKGMLKQREQRQIDYEALVEYLTRAEHELVAAEHGAPAPALSTSFLKSKVQELRGVDREQARQQRIARLKARIAMFRTESQRAKAVSDDFEELAKREVRVFDQTEAIELQQSLAGLSSSYIEFYTTVLSEFRRIESELD